MLPAQLDGEWAVGLSVADGVGVEEKDGEVAGEGLCGFVIWVIFKLNRIYGTDCYWGMVFCWEERKGDFWCGILLVHIGFNGYGWKENSW